MEEFGVFTATNVFPNRVELVVLEERIFTGHGALDDEG